MEHASVPRLLLFADICGIKCRNQHFAYDPLRCKFFFSILALIFPNPKIISTALNSKNRVVDRNLILDPIKLIFPKVDREDPAILVSQGGGRMLLLVSWPLCALITLPTGCPCQKNPRDANIRQADSKCCYSTGQSLSFLSPHPFLIYLSFERSI